MSILSKLEITVSFKDLLWVDFSPWNLPRWKDVTEETWNLKKHLETFESFVYPFAKLQLRGFHVEIAWVPGSSHNLPHIGTRGHYA